MYRLKRGLIGWGLILCGAAILGQLLLALGGYPAALLPLLIAFTVALSLPLLVGTAINPPVTATGRGLIVRPMFGRERLVPWETIRALKPHTLLPADEGLERLLYGRRNRAPRQGMWIIVSGALPIRFRLAAWIGGLGNVAAFGISAATHEDYEGLLRAIRQRTGLAESTQEG